MYDTGRFVARIEKLLVRSAKAVATMVVMVVMSVVVIQHLLDASGAIDVEKGPHQANEDRSLSHPRPRLSLFLSLSLGKVEIRNCQNKS